MAGIGFQLRKLIGKGEIGATVGAIVSGVFLVSGPWLISIASMAILQAAFARAGFADGERFQASVIYCFALSLSLFSGLHHHFTRMAADLAWEGRHGEATAWMLRFVIAAAALAIAVAIPASYVAAPGIDPGFRVLRIGFTVLFTAVNVLWIVMLFISTLRDFRVIIVVFSLGMGISVASSLVLSRKFGAGGALLGYALGFLLIDCVFIGLGLAKYPPVRPRGGLGLALSYAKTYRGLILSGFLFYAGQWTDKFIFWAIRGSSVNGLSLRLYPEYDGAVFITGLSVIPGLVYFIIMAETRLYTDLRHFLFALNHSSWTRIQASKRRVLKCVKRELWNQSALQIACSLGLASIFLLVRYPGAEGPVLWLALTAAFFQFTLLTILVFLYYFELYGEALWAALTYFALNALLAASAYALLPGMPAGLGHLVAGAAASGLGYALLIRSIYRLDRLVFLRALGA